MPSSDSGADLGEFVEVAPPPARGPLVRLLLSLLAAGLVLGVIVVIGSWLFGTFAPSSPPLASSSSPGSICPRAPRWSPATRRSSAP